MITIKNLTTHQIKALMELCHELYRVVLEHKETDSNTENQIACDAAKFTCENLLEKLHKKMLSRNFYNTKKHSFKFNPVERFFFTKYYSIAPYSINTALLANINLLLHQKEPT